SPPASEDQLPLNLLGWPGAMLADALFDSLGVAVYVLLLSWFVLVLTLFLRRDLIRWSVRLAGWLLLLPCSAMAADQLGAIVPSPTWAGSGGTLGAGLVRILAEHLLPIGRVAAFSVVLALGLYLAL